MNATGGASNSGRSTGRLPRLALILVAVHGLLMLLVVYTWNQSAQQQGFVGGQTAATASKLVSFVDFAAAPVAKAVIRGVLSSRSPFLRRALRWAGADTLVGVHLRVYWPLLLALGSLQWLLIGLGTCWLGRLKRRVAHLSA